MLTTGRFLPIWDDGSVTVLGLPRPTDGISFLTRGHAEESPSSLLVRGAALCYGHAYTTAGIPSRVPSITSRGGIFAEECLRRRIYVAHPSLSSPGYCVPHLFRGHGARGWARTGGGGVECRRGGACWAECS